MEKIIMDTHMHSKASDGVWTPREVVQNAKARGLEVIALTDHDTTFGVPEALEEAKKLGIVALPGIEIDADYDSQSGQVRGLELLGLGADLNAIAPFVTKRADARIKSLESYIASFNRYIQSANFPSENSRKKYPLKNQSSLTTEDIISWRNRRDNYHNPTPFLSKMDIVNYLLENFAIPSESVEKAKRGDRVFSGEFKKEYGFLFEGKELKPSFYEAIEAVRSAGGLAVVAHPGLSKGYEDGMVKEWELPETDWFTQRSILTPFAFIKDLKEHGLNGVELYNYRGSDKPHAASQEHINNYFSTLASRLGLVITFGSDCHGPKGNGPLMGTFGSSEIYLPSVVSRYQ